MEAKRTNHEYNVIFRGREKKKIGDSEIEDRRTKEKTKTRRQKSSDLEYTVQGSS